MAVNLTSNDTIYAGLLEHKYHRIVCVTYGFGGEDINVAIECETCGEVLLSADRPDTNAHKEG